MINQKRASSEALLRKRNRFFIWLYIQFNFFLIQIVRKSWRNPKTTVSIFLVLTALFASQISKSKIVFSAEDLAGQGMESADELKSIKERYPDGVVSLFVLRPDPAQGDFSINQLCEMRRWYSYLRNSMPELKHSVSSFDFKWPVRESETKVRYRSILDLNCHENRANTPLLVAKNDLFTSPFALAQTEKKVLEIIFQFTFNDSKISRFGSFDPNLISFLRQQVNDELIPKLSGAQVDWIGPADYQWYILEGFKFSKYINLAMVILIIIGLKIFYGRWLAGLIYVASLLFAAIWVFGSKAALGSSYDVMSTGLILIIGISTLEDFIFVSSEQIKGSSWKKSIRIMILPAFYTSLTTMVGFLSLLVSNVETVRKMGLWSSVGVAIEWWILFVVIPCFFSLFKNFKSWVASNKSHGFQLISKLSFYVLPRRLSYICLIFFPLSIWGYFNIDYNVSPHKIFPDNHEYSKAIDNLSKSKKWTGLSYLVFEPGVQLAEAEKIQKQIEMSETSTEEIAFIESPWAITNWLSHVGQIDEREAKEQFKLSKWYEQYVDSEGQIRIFIYLKETAVSNVLNLKKDVYRICQNKCHLAGEVVAYADFSATVSKTLMESLASSLILVSLIIIWLAYAKGKVHLVPSLLISSFWGPLFMIFALGVFHSTLDFWKSIFASILVGLTGDNAIQYLYASKNKNLGEGISNRCTSSIINAILMAIGSLVYLGSYYSSPRAFGIILSAGVVTALIGDLWLLKGLLPKGESE